MLEITDIGIFASGMVAGMCLGIILFGYGARLLADAAVEFMEMEKGMPGVEEEVEPEVVNCPSCGNPKERWRYCDICNGAEP